MHSSPLQVCRSIRLLRRPVSLWHLSRCQDVLPKETAYLIAGATAGAFTDHSAASQLWITDNVRFALATLDNHTHIFGYIEIRNILRDH